MEDFTVLPVKFLTVFVRRENVLSMMEDYYSDFRDNLGRLRNKIEFGIKAIWPAGKIKQSIIDAYRKGYPNASTLANSPAKMFIAEKFVNYEIDKAFDDKAGKTISAMDTDLSRFAAEKELDKLKTENMLLSAAYLVEKDEQENFRGAFEHIRAAHSGFKFLFSGPWPPYSFVRLPNKPQQFKHPGQVGMFGRIIGQPTLVGADGV
jgi:hypothetical protein